MQAISVRLLPLTFLVTVGSNLDSRALSCMTARERRKQRKHWGRERGWFKIIVD